MGIIRITTQSRRAAFAAAVLCLLAPLALSAVSVQKVTGNFYGQQAFENCGVERSFGTFYSAYQISVCKFDYGGLAQWVADQKKFDDQLGHGMLRIDRATPADQGSNAHFWYRALSLPLELTPGIAYTVNITYISAAVEYKLYTANSGSYFVGAANRSLQSYWNCQTDSITFTPTTSSVDISILDTQAAGSTGVLYIDAIEILDASSERVYYEDFEGGGGGEDKPDVEEGEIVLGDTPTIVAESATWTTQAVVRSAISTNSAVVLRNDAALEMLDFRADVGAFIKRGAGTLTINVPDARVFSVGDGNYDDSPVSFAGDAVPASGYNGFNVAEGELVVKGTGRASVATGHGTASIGLDTADNGAQPTLTIDGADMVFPGEVQLGRVNSAGATATNAALRIVNGGAFHPSVLRTASGTAGAESHPLIYLDGGKLLCTWGVFFSQSAKGHTSLYATNSVVAGKYGVYVSGDVDMEFHDSVFAGGDGNAACTLNIGGNTTGVMGFHGDSTFYVSGFAGSTSKPMRFVFDGATWNPGIFGADISFADPSAISLEAAEGGLRVYAHDNPAIATQANREFRLSQALTGPGDVTVYGGGTLRFERQSSDYAPTLCISGTAVAEAGTIAIASGAASSSAKVALSAGTTLDLCDGESTLAVVSGGAGGSTGVCTVENGTLIDTTFTPSRAATDAATTLAIGDATLIRPTFLLPYDDDAGLTGSISVGADAELSGSVTVDFGRADGAPMPKAVRRRLAVASFEGQSPDLSAWRTTNTGLVNLYGMFYAEDGIVYVDLVFTGTTLMLK